MLPAAYMPGEGRRLSPEGVEDSSEGHSDELVGQVCPNCGLELTASEVSQSFFLQLRE